MKINMVVFEPTAGYGPEMVDHVARREGLQLQLIEYMPEIAAHPEWAVDIGRVPYYGEYVVRGDDDEWEINDDYLESEGDRAPYRYGE